MLTIEKPLLLDSVRPHPRRRLILVGHEQVAMGLEGVRGGHKRHRLAGVAVLAAPAATRLGRPVPPPVFLAAPEAVLLVAPDVEPDAEPAATRCSTTCSACRSGCPTCSSASPPRQDRRARNAPGSARSRASLTLKGMNGRWRDRPGYGRQAKSREGGLSEADPPYGGSNSVQAAGHNRPPL